jgi:hypothetical protein
LSEKLRIVRPFEIGVDEQLEFVFGINVVQRGPAGRYNLLPVVGKSGVAGEDVEREVVDSESTETMGPSDGTNSTGNANS